jgi:hypothetical protein
VNAQTTAIIVAVLGFFSVLVQSLRGRGSSWRAALKEELEILSALPEGPSRDRFQNYVDHKITERTQAELVRRRDPAGMALGLSFMAIAVVGSIAVWEAGGWWNLLQILTATIGVFGLVGFFESAKKAERDEKGNRIAGSGSGQEPSIEENDAADPTEGRS